MEERKVPPPQRGNIDGIRPRKPAVASQASDSSQVPVGQNASSQNPPQVRQTVKTTVGKKPKKSKNMTVIILAVLIFIGLSGFAIYTVLNRGEDGLQKNSSTGQASSSADSKQLIDQTVNEIDQLNDQSDESGTGLSDEQLGL